MAEPCAPDLDTELTGLPAGDDRFGSTLRDHRIAAGLTQEELAALSGLSVRAIRNLEIGRTGRPQRETVRMLADALRLGDAARARLLATARRSWPATPRADDPSRGHSAGTGRCELPPDADALVGRDGVVAGLCDYLTSPRGARLATVTGPPGAGKSALVVHVAHRLRDRFPDGQIYVDLDVSPAGPMPPDAVLGRVLRSLGVFQVSDHVEERAALLRASLAALRAVLVLDDATSEAQIRPLLAGAGRSVVLVASRRWLPALRDGHAVGIDGLHEDDAVALLDDLIGADRTRFDRAAVHSIARQCESLPLALQIAGAWLAARPHRRPRDLAALLADDRRRLGHLQIGDLAMRTSIAACHRRLTGTEQHLLHRLSALRPDCFDAHLVADVLDATVPAAEEIIEQLRHAQLISFAERATDGALRYRLRHLVSLFAAEHPRVSPPAPVPMRLPVRA